MRAVFQREFLSYFKGTVGYVFAAVFVFMLGIFSSSINFAAAVNGFEYSLYNVCFVYLILIPILTMRSVAEEKRQKTDQLLLSLPLSSTKIVLAKYFAMLSVLSLPLLIAALIPPVMSLYGKVNFPLAYASLLGFFLLGAALVALGMFLSSLTENQIVAAVVSFVVLLIAYFMGSISQLVSSSAQSSLFAFLFLACAAAGVFYLLTKKTSLSLGVLCVLCCVCLVLFFAAPDALVRCFEATVSSLGLFDRFYTFVNGVFDLRSLSYYLSVSFLFVFLTVSSMEKRRWS